MKSYFPDFSHHQKVTDWQKIKDQTGTVILKASQGTEFMDSKFLEYRAAARAKGILVGAYHFAGKGLLDGNGKLYFVAQDAKDEATHFVKTVGVMLPGEFLVLDWEIPHDNVTEWCKRFLLKVEELTGLTPLIYLNESTVNRYDWSFISNRHPLWIAKYGMNLDSMGIPPKTGSWKEYSIWQYTSRHPMTGVVGAVDYNFTEKNLALYGLPGAPQAPTSPLTPLWHRFGHMDRNFVRKGDFVKKGQKIGTVGDGNGQWYAHLHYDISRKEIKQEYIRGMNKAQVAAQYVDPHQYELGQITQSDHMGFDYLAWNGYGYHPGVDLNGKGAGNADFGNPIYSPVDGVVTYEVRTWLKNQGWGNVIVIKEN